ncbi:hypothetical protein J3R30DRAFT_1132585 [Lentinula aciculospora]|uniref:Uncharacterized protein n=1 Tax=Lentinula aciculospora TaxID=153920 RepID=A0A9W9DHH1_9AGAR|nr:hypothetical protein J3R30DRAFT_1132585 [Lentinula aciculospora]
MSEFPSVSNSIPFTTMNTILCFPRTSSSSPSSSSRSILVTNSIPTSEELQRGYILLQVDKLGWSTNNVTYQALGEHSHFRYYDFHPAPISSSASVTPQTHGVVPVWGFGTIVASAHPRVTVGERLYGYFAPAKYLILPIDEKDANKYSMYVPRPHLPADRKVYNQIQRCSTDPLYTRETEDLTMLYRPLFWTSYWCQDWLACSGYRGGCDYILISSASSKTAFCFAYCVRKRVEKEHQKSFNVRIIGLTSKGNLDFTRKLGLYDEVYDMNKSQSESQSKWIYIDVAGNQALNSNIHTHFASPYAVSKLVVTVSLGMTNLAPGETNAEKIEWTTNLKSSSTMQDSGRITTTYSSSAAGFWPLTEQFFSPEWLAIRRLQLTSTQMLDAQKEAWADLMRDCPSWVKLEYVYGAEHVQKAYEGMMSSSGGLAPDKGWIWSMWDGASVGAEIGKAKL